MQNPPEYIEEFDIAGSFSFSQQLLRVRSSNLSELEQLLVTVHEYTHYLQSMTTTSGIITMRTHIMNLLMTLYNINLNSVSPPFSKSSNLHLDKLLNERMSIARQYIPNREPIPFSRKPNNSTGRSYVKSPDPRTYEILDLLHLAEEGKSHWVPVTRQTIRENMAKMAEWSIRRTQGLNHEERMFSLPSHYYIIYLEVKKIHKQRDPVDLTYFICELALMFPQPEIAIDKILLNLGRLGSDQGLRRSFGKFVKQEGFFQKIQMGLSFAQSKLEADKSFFHRKEGELGLMRVLLQFYDIMLRGIETRKKHLTLYMGVMDANWLERMAKDFGSPISIGADASTFVLHRNDDLYAPDNDLLAIWFSINVILDILCTKERLLSCPFYQDLPICDVEKDIDICEQDPQSVRRAEHLSGCPLWNAFTALGAFA